MEIHVQQIEFYISIEQQFLIQIMRRQSEALNNPQIPNSSFSLKNSDEFAKCNADSDYDFSNHNQFDIPSSIIKKKKANKISNKQSAIFKEDKDKTFILSSGGHDTENSQKGDLTIIFEESEQFSKFTSFNKDSYRYMQHKAASPQNLNSNSERRGKNFINNEKRIYNDFTKVQDQKGSKNNMRKIKINQKGSQNQFIAIKEQQNQPSFQSKKSQAFDNKQTIIRRLDAEFNQQNNWTGKHTSILPQFSQVRSSNQDVETFQQCLSIDQFADRYRNQALKNYKQRRQQKKYYSNIQQQPSLSIISNKDFTNPYHQSQQNIDTFQTKKPTLIKNRPLNLLYF